MGGRCDLQMHVRKADIEKVCEVTALEPGDFSDQDVVEKLAVYFEDGEANYGMFDERQSMADCGVVFYGSHGAGDNYGSYVFACDGTRYADVPSQWDGLRPAVGVGRNGLADKESLAHARDYWKILARAKKLLEGEIKQKPREAVEKEAKV